MGVRFLALVPMLTAVLGIACALRPSARRLLWPTLALAAANVVLTPLTSGEWFYQRAEDPAYEQAVARGDFAAYDQLLRGHDPHLHPRMVAMAVALLVSLVVLGVLRRRGVSPAVSALAVVAVLGTAGASFVQGLLIL